MGDDVRAVEAARVSFDAEAGEDAGAREVDVGSGSKKRERIVRDANERDAKLVKYLGDHNHWTPFAHITITFIVSAPIFVARQLDKHTVGLAKNEISRRYVDFEPEFYVPSRLRGRPVNKKQGSNDAVTVEGVDDIKRAYDFAAKCYGDLIARGVAPEQARMVLPQGMMTSWYWTGSLAAFARVCNLRLAPDAQEETREVAAQISEHVRRIAPKSWAAMCRHN